ncbi:hypothetical protein X945_5937 [Burkholderia pseudomallei ABCPW 107]|nr:hypothetical protein X945_5937 [Burkholderia pseudomallei ABCPW 107]
MPARRRARVPAVSADADGNRRKGRAMRPFRFFAVQSPHGFLTVPRCPPRRAGRRR